MSANDKPQLGKLLLALATEPKILNDLLWKLENGNLDEDQLRDELLELLAEHVESECEGLIESLGRHLEARHEQEAFANDRNGETVAYCF